MNKLDERKGELELSIAELEANLSELRKRLSEIEKERQHEAIDNLEEYLLQLDGKYETMKRLWGAVRNEVRQILRPSEEDS